MRIRDVDVKRMSHETGIRTVTIEAAFSSTRRSSRADKDVRDQLQGALLADAFYLYKCLPMGSDLEMAAIRRIATFFQK